MKTAYRLLALPVALAAAAVLLTLRRRRSRRLACDHPSIALEVALGQMETEAERTPHESEHARESTVNPFTRHLPNVLIREAGL